MASTGTISHKEPTAKTKANKFGYRRPFLVPLAFTEGSIRRNEHSNESKQTAATIPLFDSSEHDRLGNAVNLRWSDGTIKNGLRKDPVTLQKKVPFKFTLANDLQVTYGEINALAGDFYATDKIISDYHTLEDQTKAFLEAFDTLNAYERSATEAPEILAVLQKEINALNKAITTGTEQPSQAIEEASKGETTSFEEITAWRLIEYAGSFPDYLSVSANNLDHFGADAHTAYNAGHEAALKLASSQKDEATLAKAYAMNAFADHFLEDCFSAGHMRTPRRALHTDNPLVDLCAKSMHDEDGIYGLKVVSLKQPSQPWTAYGDGRLYDGDDTENFKRCFEALQASADDIFYAWDNQNPASTQDPRQYLPTLASALSHDQKLAPLFILAEGSKTQTCRRQDIEYLHSWKFTAPDDWWALSTLIEIECSSLW